MAGCGPTVADVVGAAGVDLKTGATGTAASQGGDGSAGIDGAA